MILLDQFLAWPMSEQAVVLFALAITLPAILWFAWQAIRPRGEG